MEYISKRYPIEYEDGEVKFVKMLSVYGLEVVRCRFNEILLYLKELDIKLENIEEITLLYFEDEIFKTVVNELFEEFEIEVQKLDFHEMFNLILPYQKIDSKRDGELIYSSYGKLLEFVFDNDEEPELRKAQVSKASASEKKDLLLNTIGILWSLTKDIEQSLFLVKNFSGNDLNAIIASRTESETPAEEKAKKKAQNKAKETIKKMSENAIKKKDFVKKTATKLSEDEADKLLKGMF